MHKKYNIHQMISEMWLKIWGEINFYLTLILHIKQFKFQMFYRFI